MSRNENKNRKYVYITFIFIFRIFLDRNAYSEITVLKISMGEFLYKLYSSDNTINAL